MDLAFQVPMQYCSLQHWTLLPSPVTYTTGCCFCFGFVSSFFLVISPLFSSSTLGTCQPGSSSFSVISFFFFTLFVGFSRQEYWNGLPFPSPMDHVLSELSTMTRLSWVALHIMVHSFLELDRLCFGYLMDLPIKHFQKFCITFIYLIYFTSLSLKIVWLMNFPRGNNSYKFNILNLNATKLKFS